MSKRRVYFHRSRMFVNGSKIASSTSLDDELAPGDPVLVDVVLNQSPEESLTHPPFVYSQSAFWVALSVQLNTRDRGNRIAQKLREEVVTRNLSRSRTIPPLFNVTNFESMTEIMKPVVNMCQVFRLSELGINVSDTLHFSESRWQR